MEDDVCKPDEYHTLVWRICVVTKTNGLRRDLGKNRLGPFSDGTLCVWEDSALSIVFDVKKNLFVKGGLAKPK